MCFNTSPISSCSHPNLQQCKTKTCFTCESRHRLQSQVYSSKHSSITETNKNCLKTNCTLADDGRTIPSEDECNVISSIKVNLSAFTPPIYENLIWVGEWNTQHTKMKHTQQPMNCHWWSYHILYHVFTLQTCAWVVK